MGRSERDSPQGSGVKLTDGCAGVAVDLRVGPALLVDGIRRKAAVGAAAGVPVVPARGFLWLRWLLCGSFVLLFLLFLGWVGVFGLGVAFCFCLSLLLGFLGSGFLGLPLCRFLPLLLGGCLSRSLFSFRLSCCFFGRFLARLLSSNDLAIRRGNSI